MNDADKLGALVDSLVIPDRKSAPGNVDRDATLKTLSAILQGGRESIAGVADMLVEPGKGDDSKARYALHTLAVQIGSRRDDGERRLFTGALASSLKKDRPREVRGFLVRQLQVVGGREVMPFLGKLLLDEEVCDEAAQALLAIKAGAAEQFRAALPKAAGRPRLAIVQGVGTLRDKESAKLLHSLAADKDREVRLAALWALANSGDAASADLLIKASGAEGYERIKAASACLLLAERLLSAGQKTEAARLYTHLRDTRTDAGEQHVRDAAVRGLAALK